MKVLINRPPSYAPEVAEVEPILDPRFKDSDLVYKDPDGGLVSCCWDLLFVQEGLQLASEPIFRQACDKVDMPGEYDWSFFRDADKERLEDVKWLLYRSVGPKMKKMGLASALNVKIS